jgi:hypothetical protein
MVLRPRPAAAFFALTVLACLAVSLTTKVVSAQAAAGMIPLTRQPAADGTISLWEISPARAESLPPWDPRTGTPPLSVDAAMKVAEAWLKQQHPEIATFEPLRRLLEALISEDTIRSVADEANKKKRKLFVGVTLPSCCLTDRSSNLVWKKRRGIRRGRQWQRRGGGPRIFPVPSPTPAVFTLRGIA